MARDTQAVKNADLATLKAAGLTTTEDLHPVVQAIMGSDFYESEVADAFSMAAQLLAAASPEDLLSEQQGDVTHADDVLGKPFMLLGVKFLPSSIEDGNEDFPLFAIMDVSWNGEKDVLSCGGLNVCVAAYKLAAENWLPRMVTIKKRDKATRAGFHPLNLVAAAVAEGGAAEPF